MKKTLKLVAIFMAIMVVGIAGGLTVYYLIQNNKTYYIYDLRIVEPVEEAPMYVYLNDAYEYKNFKNKKVYMTSSADNSFEIGIYASTSLDTRDVTLVSSDPSVAYIEILDGKCYVRYKKAGMATITASIDMVTDSFDLYVYNQAAEDLNIYDNEYYGEYAERYTNQIVAYADDLVYQYDIVANSAFLDKDNENINLDLLRIDETSINKDVFESIKIDAQSKKLTVQCKSSLNATLIADQRTEHNESIVLQSYYYSEQGEIKTGNSYPVEVRVIADTPEFLQVEVAATPDFNNSYIFMDTLDFEGKNDEYISSNIEDFLSYQKAEMYLAQNGEKSVYKTFFTDRISEIYIKFRKVYTNGDIVYLNPANETNPKEQHPYTLTCEEEFLKLSENKEYYVLKLNRSYFEESGSIVRSFNINVKLDDYINFDSDFMFEFKNYSAENVLLFYDFDAVKQCFVYSYWDLRAQYHNEICNEQGDIINFGGIDIDFSTYPKPPVPPSETEPEEEVL